MSIHEFQVRLNSNTGNDSANNTFFAGLRRLRQLEEHLGLNRKVRCGDFFKNFIPWTPQLQ